MQLRYRELETDVARLAQTTAQAQRRGATLAEPPTTLAPIWSVFSVLAAIALVGLYALVFFHTGGIAAVLLLLLSPVVLLAIITVSTRLVALPSDYVTPAVIHDLLQTAELSPAHRLYGETLLLVLESPSKQQRTLKELLREVNALTADDSRMATYRERVVASVDPTALLRTEAERESLTRRLAATDDPVVRLSLTESLALCTARLEQQRSFPQTLARLDAHRELIYQALSLAHTTLLRARTAPLVLALPELSVLKASVMQLNSEARALEEATTGLSSTS